MKNNIFSNLLTAKRQGLIISVASPAASIIFFLLNGHGDRSNRLLLFLPFLTLFAVTGLVFGLYLQHRTENSTPAIANQSGGAE